jgi:hypothetical protein
MELYFAEMEADHLLASKLPDDDLEAAFVYFGIDAAAFEMDALSNRAPMCGPTCNRGKSNRPLSHTKASEELLQKARDLAPRIEALAASYRSADEIAKAAVVLKDAIEDGLLAGLPHGSTLATALEAIVLQGPAAASAALGIAGRPHTRYEHVEYVGFASGLHSRNLWLIEPPGMQPVALIVEYEDDEGTSIQNAAESIAAAVAQRYPEHISVLHYDEDEDSSWRRFFMPVPRAPDGSYVFGRSLGDFPQVVRSLRAAKFDLPPSASDVR